MTSRMLARLLATAILVAGSGAFTAVPLLGAAPASAATPVAVYPTPGDKYELPATQITFRGIPASQIGTVTVTDSESGVHTGQIKADSDGNGGSFIPAKPFTAGEKVTVKTGLDVVGGSHGTFSFTIESPGPALAEAPVAAVKAARNGVQHFHSAPNLQPPGVTVTKDAAPASDGDVFVAPQFGPVQNGPMILDPHGNVVWFDPFPISEKTLVTDFRVQHLHGAPVLTWWQGNMNGGSGRGEDVILNDKYQRIATVHAGNGLRSDLHEFFLTNSGDAYITAVSPVKLPGVSRTVENSVIQEVDVATGLVLFQWDALDHVSLNDSYAWGPNVPGHILDPYHANSISLAGNGDPVVSMRNTSTVYEIDRSTGKVLWRLGGKSPTFKMGSGTVTAFQHDAVVHPNGQISIFDDGAGPPKVHPYSRGIVVALNQSAKTATLVRQFGHAPALSANFEGGVQELAGGRMFAGWGQQPDFSEVNAQGQQIFDGHFNEMTGSYRAYRFPWSARPATAPRLAIGTSASGATTSYETWNGATGITAWRVLAGTSAKQLVALGRYARYRFESTLTPHTGDPVLQVQALGSHGQVLATSAAHSAPNHVQVFGASAFVSNASGMAGLPVGCYSSKACHLVATVTAGRSVLARSGRQYYGAGRGGILFFRLSPSGRRELARARGNRLRVRVSVSDSAGARSAAATINLIGFRTSGSAPKRSYHQSSALQVIGGTDFVSSRGAGGILAQCQSASPCHTTVTVSAGKQTIAKSRPEWLGAHQLGYLHFSLSSSGRSLLAHRHGNQPPVGVQISGGGASASASLALVEFR